MQEEGQKQQLAVQNEQTNAAGWSFTGGQAAEQAPQPINAIQWSASEFIAHDKNSNWYLLLTVGTIFIAGITYLLSREFFTPLLICITGLLFGITAARRPRELQYAIDEKGVYVGEKFYAYSGFKSFSIVQEGATESIWFMPLKRFSPSLNIYFAPDDGSRIVNALSQFLPVEGKELDPIDRLMHRIGF